MDNLLPTKLMVSALRLQRWGQRSSTCPLLPDFSPIENCWSKVKEFLRALFGTNLCSVRPSHHGCSCCSDNQGHNWLVYPLLLLYLTQLRTAVSLQVARDFILEHLKQKVGQYTHPQLSVNA
jgi:hypothetical protein